MLSILKTTRQRRACGRMHQEHEISEGRAMTNFSIDILVILEYRDA